MRMIVIGCGLMGSGLAQALTLRGHAVTVVDKDPAALERLGPSFKGNTLIGIGFDRDVLVQAGIERADGLAAVTVSDEANVVAARLANQFFRVPRVVARVYDPLKAEIYRRLGLQTIAPVPWGIERVVDLLCYSQVNVTASLGNGGVGIADVEAPALLVGRPIESLNAPGEVQVAAISRQGKTFMPTPGTLFREGDTLHLVVEDTSGEQLNKILGLR